MSSRKAYFRYLTSSVRQTVNLAKLNEVEVSPKWVLGLTDTILRQKQKQYLDKNGEPPAQLVTDIAGKLFEEFKQIKNTLQTGEVSDPKIPKLIQNSEKREVRKEKTFSRKVKNLQSRGVPKEAAEETVKEQETAKLAPIAEIIPADKDGKPIAPAIDKTFIDITRSGEISLTVPGLGFWQAGDTAKAFIDSAQEAGTEYQRFIIRDKQGNKKIISGKKEATLKKTLQKITDKMNAYNKARKDAEKEAEEKAGKSGGGGGGGGGGSGGGSGAESAYAEVEAFEDGSDFIIEFDFPDDFDTSDIF